MKVNEIGFLENILSQFGEAHNLLAKTKLSKEDYNPISALLAEAKIDLFNYYNQKKGETPREDGEWISVERLREIRNHLYEQVPTGSVDSLAILAAIGRHLKYFDSIIDSFPPHPKNKL